MTASTNQPPAAVLVRVEGMTCDGCAEAVRRAVRGIDPGAEVEVDRPAGRVTVRSAATSLAVVDAIARAGYVATEIAG